jgi:hypothetical protein
METRPTIICLTVTASDVEVFDRKVTVELNDMRWYRYTHVIHFQQDEHSFYAHIVFTERMNWVDLKKGG